ncbi:MAG TPA: hypothetical protein VJ777_04035 [Mycobacterium sp.]|nr:hypothetical protein [Mycobacterium sp.]
MRRTLLYFTPLMAAAGAAAAILAAPSALAQPAPTLPQCVDTGGAEAIGGSTTECSTPGNIQINATPAEPTYVYPWDDEFYGPALIFGGGGYHGGGGGGHGGGGR